MTVNNKIVSFDDEKLILVDDSDKEIGHKSKAECHDGQGILHRAFSIFIFNSKKELLLQKRGGEKRLWPLYWSNSCCSHPREGETYDFATQRRLKEELGFGSDLSYLFKFKYHASFEDKGSEYELCSVFIGRSDQKPEVNPNEIEEWKFIQIDELEKQMENNPEWFTPWFKMEWKRIKNEYIREIESLF